MRQQRMERVGRVRNKTRRQKTLAYVDRVIARMNRAAGHGKRPRKWHHADSTVVAFTRSEARSAFKKKFGIKGRLPVGFEITKGQEIEQDQQDCRSEDSGFSTGRTTP